MKHLKDLILKLKRLEKQLEEIRESKQEFKDENEKYLEKIQRYNVLKKETNLLLMERDHIKREYEKLENLNSEILDDREKQQTKLILLVCALFLNFLLTFSNPPIHILVNILIFAGAIDSLRFSKKIREKQLNYSRKIGLIHSKNDKISNQMDRVYNELESFDDINEIRVKHDKDLARLDNAEELEEKKQAEIDYLKQYIFEVYKEKIIGLTEEQKAEITSFIETEVPGLLSSGVKKMLLEREESDN